MTRESVETRIMEELGTVLNARPATKKLMLELSKFTSFALYGGCLRDLLLFGEIKGDIDIVTECNEEILTKYLQAYAKPAIPPAQQSWSQIFTDDPILDATGPIESISSRGMFGGTKLDLDGEKVDIWAFERTLGLHIFESYFCPWQALVDRTDFSSNCIALVLNKGGLKAAELFMSGNYCDLLAAKRMDINNPLSYPAESGKNSPDLARRALKQMAQKGLAPTQGMVEFIMAYIR